MSRMRVASFMHWLSVEEWGRGSVGLEDVGIALDGPGVVTGRTVAKAFTDELVAAIGLHRAWARADDVMASAVPPA